MKYFKDTNGSYYIYDDDAAEYFYADKIPVTKEEHEAAVAAATTQAEAETPYTVKRLREYPDFRDYLDGIVKGDQAQVQAYIDACLAVKAKYPKE